MMIAERIDEEDKISQDSDIIEDPIIEEKTKKNLK